MRKKLRLSLNEKLSQMDKLTRSKQNQYHGGGDEFCGNINPTFSITPPPTQPPISFGIKPITIGGTIYF